MDDYIKREDAIKAIHDEWDEVCNYDGSGHELANEMESVIDRVPTDDVAPVVHGEYIERKAAIALADGGCHPANVATEIAKLPAADVATVVRCKDCKHWFLAGKVTGSCDIDALLRHEEFWCAAGERRDGNG